MTAQPNNWKWKNSSDNAFNLISQSFGINSNKLASIKDGETTRILKAADESEVQVKRTQDAVRGLKKTWKNQLKIASSLHGLVRTGLGLLSSKQRQESKTTKEYAKYTSSTSVLNAQTHKEVQKTYLRGQKEIEKSGKDLARFRGELDDRYNLLEEQSNQASIQRRMGFRDRAQKRIAANARPWRNY